MSTITVEQVESTIIDTIASFGTDADDITRCSTFEELEIDSLDLLELAQIIEDKYGVVLTSFMASPELTTVGDMIDLIASSAGRAPGRQ
jgi:acyl carrier protein